MNILDMTLRQIIQAIGHNMAIDLVVLSGALNLEAIVRQVAVNKGYKGVVSWCDRIASVITFVFDVVTTAVKKQAPKAVPLVFLCFGLVFSMGCASYNQKAVCLQLGTTNASIPYVGGATNGSGYACYLSCIGSKCPTPNGADITSLMANELTASNNKIVTAGPVVITATPVK